MQQCPPEVEQWRLLRLLASSACSDGVRVVVMLIAPVPSAFQPMPLSPVGEGPPAVANASVGSMMF